jgi:hypothetical protein
MTKALQIATGMGKAHALNSMAILRFSQTRHSEAVALFRKGIAAKPQDSNAHHNFAIILDAARRDWLKQNSERGSAMGVVPVSLSTARTIESFDRALDPSMRKGHPFDPLKTLEVRAKILVQTKGKNGLKIIFDEVRKRRWDFFWKNISVHRSYERLVRKLFPRAALTYLS